MIHRIYSDLTTFKELRFRQGLNILLSQKSPGASMRQTRNRAGKTSLIELIHFLAGGSCKPDSIFRSDALSEYSFGCEMDLKEKRISISRSGSVPSKVVVKDGDASDWPVEPLFDKKLRENVISNSNWRIVLGKMWFDLNQSEDEDSDESYEPSFRSLFPYFVRRQSSGGFVSPFRHSELQQIGDQQVSLFYLLGLDWTIAQEWQKIRNRERMLREVKKAAGEGALGSVIGSAAELRTRLAVAEEKSTNLENTMKTFKVLPEYHKLEQEATELTTQLSAMADLDTVDRHLLSDLKKSLTDERPPTSLEIERLYKEVGVVFPSAAVRRFEEVKEFHESVIRNRKHYLSEEITSIELRVRKREAEMEPLDRRRAEIMSILFSHGALDQYTKLHAELIRLRTETETVRQQFEIAENMESQRAELSVERGKLLAQLQHEYREREKVLRKTILAFEGISNQLYERAGSLTISESLNGPEFDVVIQGSRSKGIINMQLFCFDMMLMQLAREKGLGPGFLVHDSHIFDGVDDRQVAKALEVGAQAAKSLGFQYIVTMNSDILDTVKPNLTKEFPLDDYILDTKLTDETEHGGLFGVRFE